jgi:hypothetical protein
MSTVIDEVGAWLVDCVTLDVGLLTVVILDSLCSRKMIDVSIATITAPTAIKIFPFMISNDSLYHLQAISSLLSNVLQRLDLLSSDVEIYTQSN